jgi:hypothetical protein
MGAADDALEKAVSLLDRCKPKEGQTSWSTLHVDWYVGQRAFRKMPILPV